MITATDSLDGWLARRDGATRSGAFLDPVADKLIVLGGLAVLADRGDVPVVAGRRSSRVRELGISLYRSIAGRRGIVAARRSGSGSTRRSSQYLAVGVVLLPLDRRLGRRSSSIVLVRSRSALTVVSGSTSCAAATSTGSDREPEREDGADAM